MKKKILTALILCLLCLTTLTGCSGCNKIKLKDNPSASATVTSNGGLHFKNLPADLNPDGTPGAFLPGEDIEIEAVAYKKF